MEERYINQNGRCKQVRVKLTVAAALRVLYSARTDGLQNLYNFIFRRSTDKCWFALNDYTNKHRNQKMTNNMIVNAENLTGK